MTTFAEVIPEHCPPGDAFQPQGLEVFRLIEIAPPTDLDFQSHAVRWPEKFGRRSDCDYWSVSVFAKLESLSRIRGLKAHSHKRVARLVLVPESGQVQQTGQDEDHYSWWRFASFNPIPRCEVAE